MLTPAARDNRLTVVGPALSQMAPQGSTVWVLPDQELMDQYDRTLLYLWSARGDTVFINRAMVAKRRCTSALPDVNEPIHGEPEGGGGFDDPAAGLDEVAGVSGLSA